MREILAAAIVGLVCCVGCNRSPPDAHEIRFIIPTGFRGCFRVMDGGARPPRIAGIYTIEVPPNGLVRIDSLQLLDTWHRQSASFSDGQSLAVESERDGIGFYCLFSSEEDDERATWFFVGAAVSRPYSGLEAKLGSVIDGKTDGQSDEK